MRCEFILRAFIRYLNAESEGIRSNGKLLGQQNEGVMCRFCQLSRCYEMPQYEQ